MEEPKEIETLNKDSFDYLNRPLSSVAPTIVQPQTIAAAPPPPVNPAVNPTGLTPTEEALLSPTEKAIRLRSKPRTVV